MSRFNPNHHVAPIYDAAATWKDNCFLADGSVLSEGGNLWTTNLLGELDQRFVKNLDAGEGDFLSKLQVQLSEGSPDCRRLMADPDRAAMEATVIAGSDLRSDMKDFAPSCFHSASTGGSNANAAPEGGA